MNLDDNNKLTGTGYLIVRVTTASGAIPLEGAQVGIREYSPENEGGGEFVAANLWRHSSAVPTGTPR